jgi:polysaccharide export outer membrane protein
MTPGIVEMPAKITVLEAIMQAGGFNMQEAEIQNIVVIRHRENQRYGYSLDLKPIMNGGQTKPFYLQAQDIVYVPRTEIAKVGQWVDQHINRVVPQTGFLFSKRMGDTTIGIDTSSRY